MSEPLLTAADLCCERDGRTLFADLNLSLAEGDLLQIEGANGSGKTTLLRILTGFSDNFEGEVKWQGEPLSAVRTEYHAELNYLGHLPGIKLALTPLENLNWYAALAGNRCEQSVEAILARAGLCGYEDVPCYTLSAGQQRRVNLARLYLVPAKLWVLDEPFTAIDTQGVDAIEASIEEQVAAGGAVIFTSHQSLSRLPNIRRLSLDQF